MKPVKLCLVSTNCPVGRWDENWNNCLGLIKKAAGKNADIVVFPEMNLTGYATGRKIADYARAIDNCVIQSFQKLSDQLNLAILAGLAEKTDTPKKTFASHLVFIPGTVPGKYQKLHIAPSEQEVFAPGYTIPVFAHAGITFGIQLCYDAHFPELSTAMAMQGADLIVLPHASPRGTPEEKHKSWMRHLPARAFDNGVFIAAVNQAGDNGAGLDFPGLSLVIGPDGYIVSRSMARTSHLHFVDLDPALLCHVRSHRMRYFLPSRRNDLFPVNV
jgi:predicted amidohydrolase